MSSAHWKVLARAQALGPVWVEARASATETGSEQGSDAAWAEGSGLDWDLVLGRSLVATRAREMVPGMEQARAQALGPVWAEVTGQVTGLALGLWLVRAMGEAKEGCSVEGWV